jgi:hypothetical protein
MRRNDPCVLVARSRSKVSAMSIVSEADQYFNGAAQEFANPQHQQALAPLPS